MSGHDTYLPIDTGPRSRQNLVTDKTWCKTDRLPAVTYKRGNFPSVARYLEGWPYLRTVQECSQKPTLGGRAVEVAAERKQSPYHA
jgi:hypothetical protein